jgi:hypothetical protein
MCRQNEILRLTRYKAYLKLLGTAFARTKCSIAAFNAVQCTPQKAWLRNISPNPNAVEFQDGHRPARQDKSHYAHNLFE